MRLDNYRNTRTGSQKSKELKTDKSRPNASRLWTVFSLFYFSLSNLKEFCKLDYTFIPQVMKVNSKHFIIDKNPDSNKSG